MCIDKTGMFSFEILYFSVYIAMFLINLCAITPDSVKVLNSVWQLYIRSLQLTVAYLEWTVSADSRMPTDVYVHNSLLTCLLLCTLRLLGNYCSFKKCVHFLYIIAILCSNLACERLKVIFVMF